MHLPFKGLQVHSLPKLIETLSFIFFLVSFINPFEMIAITSFTIALKINYKTPTLSVDRIVCVTWCDSWSS